MSLTKAKNAESAEVSEPVKNNFDVIMGIFACIMLAMMLFFMYFLAREKSKENCIKNASNPQVCVELYK